MENLKITLWVNEHKKTEKQPDYTATIKIGDKFEDVGGGWKKVSPTSGKKFLSLSFKTELVKRAITEVMNKTNSDGTQQPDFRQPEERDNLDF